MSAPYLKFYNDVRNRAIAKAAAGSDARMSGCELPVVINSSSGNQGITVSVPSLKYAKGAGLPQGEAVPRAGALRAQSPSIERRVSGVCPPTANTVSAGVPPGVPLLAHGGRSESCLPHPRQRAGHRVRYHLQQRQSPAARPRLPQRRGWDCRLPHVPERGQQFRGGDGIVSKGVENISPTSVCWATTACGRPIRRSSRS